MTAQITCPDQRTFPMGQPTVGRSVRLVVAKPGTGYRAVPELLLIGGTTAADIFCPMARVLGAVAIRDGTVDQVSVWESPAEGEPAVEVLRAEHYLGLSRAWESTIDLGLEREKSQAVAPTVSQPVRAPQAVAVAPPRPLTKAELRAKKKAERLAEIAAKKQAAAAAKLRKQQAAEFARWLWTVGLSSIVIALVVLLVRFRIQILRFWFLHFDPHPATPLIEAAITEPGSAIEGVSLLASVLAELPPNGAVRREARLIQAERLYGRLRAASIARQLAYAEKSRRQEVELHEKIAFRGMQESLMHASIALERAKAAYATALSLKKIGTVQ